MDSNNNEPVAAAGRGGGGGGECEGDEGAAVSPLSGEDTSLSSLSLDEAGKGGRRRRGADSGSYNLRKSSLRTRQLTEQKKQQQQQQQQKEEHRQKQQQSKERKSKTRPPPLSKYRRRTANARERCRMAEINDAFEVLKQALPQAGLDREGEGQQAGMVGEGQQADRAGDGQQAGRAGDGQQAGRAGDGQQAGRAGDGQQAGRAGDVTGRVKSQPTKVTVLRLAINYIAALRNVLGYTAGGGSGLDTSSMDSGADSSMDTSSTDASSSDSSTADGGVSCREEIVLHVPPSSNTLCHASLITDSDNLCGRGSRGASDSGGEEVVSDVALSTTGTGGSCSGDDESCMSADLDTSRTRSTCLVDTHTGVSCLAETDSHALVDGGVYCHTKSDRPAPLILDNEAPRHADNDCTVSPLVYTKASCLDVGFHVPPMNMNSATGTLCPAPLLTDNAIHKTAPCPAVRCQPDVNQPGVNCNIFCQHHGQPSGEGVFSMDPGERSSCPMDTAEVDEDGMAFGDLDFFDSSLAADFSPELSLDFTATLSPEEAVCLELVTSVF